MTQIHHYGSARPAFSSEPHLSLTLRAAEPDPPWEATPPAVPSNPEQPDPQEAARRAVGNRLVEAAIRALDWPNTPTALAPSAAAQSALDEALDVASQALAGVDFLTQLEFSAVHQGAGFKEVAQRFGMDPQEMPQDTRERIDTRMGQRFAEAAATGAAPVDRRTASQWLHNELFILTC